jgi:hypothetical protein
VTQFPTINRHAVILVPTQACLEWVRSCPGDDKPLGEVEREPTVYLIPESDADPETYIRRHFKAMFEEELNSWYTDPELWPKDRSYKTFKKFFMVQVSTMVFDLGKGMIVRDED